MKKAEYDAFMKYLAKELIQMAVVRNMKTLKKTIKKKVIEDALKGKDKSIVVNVSIDIDDGAIRLLYTQFEKLLGGVFNGSVD